MKNEEQRNEKGKEMLNIECRMSNIEYRMLKFENNAEITRAVSRLPIHEKSPMQNIGLFSIHLLVDYTGFCSSFLTMGSFN